MRTYFGILLFYFLLSPLQWSYLLGDQISVDKDFFLISFYISSFACAYFISKVSRLIFVFAPLQLICLLGISYEEYGLVLFGFSILPMLPLLKREHRKCIWRSDKNRLFRSPRRKIPLPVTINSRYNQSFTTFCHDISLSGFFIAEKDIELALSSQSASWSDLKLEVDQEVDIKIQVGTFRFIRCYANIVRINKAMGDYPSGIGFQFMNMNYQDRSWLRKLLRSYAVVKPTPTQKIAA